MTTHFGALVAAALGARVAQLDPRIAARFGSDDGHLRFQGVMQLVSCSPLGWLAAQLMRPWSLLPAAQTRAVPTVFDIEARAGQLNKRRTYRFAIDNVFTFQSRVGAAPTLHERFDGPFGMRLALDVIDGALRFRDDGYFVAIGRFRFTLPGRRWLPRFELIHSSMSAQRFAVVLRVSHALLGTLFVQRGEFERVAGGRGDASAYIVA